MRKIVIAIALMSLASAVMAEDCCDERSAIALAIDDNRMEQVYPELLAMHRERPNDAGVMSLLARIEYLRAVDGLSNHAGEPPKGWDAAHMQAAEEWVKKAIEINPSHANALVVYGQIKYAQRRYSGSLRMLELAESVDPKSVKLRLRKGATLHALAKSRGDNTLLDAAEREYKKVIRGAVDDGNERLAASHLADFASARGDYKKAVAYLTLAIATSSGSETAFLLDDRAKAHLFAGDAESALADIRQSLSILNFGVGRETLAMVSLVKSGEAMKKGDPEGARSYLQTVLATGADTERLLSILSTSPKTFSAFYAFLEPRFRAEGGEQLFYRLLCNAAGIISSDDLQRLKSFGVSFDKNYPGGWTLLFCAIELNNVAGVRALLGLGADTSIRHPNGSTLLETTLIGTSRERKQIRNLILGKVGAPDGWQDPNVDLPIKGRWYKAARDIRAKDGKTIPTGAILLAGEKCLLMSNDVCLQFSTESGEYFGMIVIPLSQISDLKALREVSAPSGTSAMGK